MTKLIKNTVKDIIDHDEYEVPAEVSETEAKIYDWVVNSFGESEAEDPSWNIHALAEWLDGLNRLQANTNTVYEPSNTVKYRL